ncbi:SGNH hydrolase-type esterase domain-containing protein [Lineolata rhizophorae]|uniref:SGNH hydrolase-type esterase domain-containing protein n=1 Tax=Lineolata rhizophorae TaxID=578093 RepID=A0A6A6NRF6_9PEZI|nr:SGNH hydrolase-type esterase domain-containing protein [Lineolata rhizophorae]
MVGLKIVTATGTLAAAVAAQSISYMPFGDSITEIVCWRGYLWEDLQDAGYTDVDFVGSMTTQNPDGCPMSGYDIDNEGHSGYLAIDIANQNQLVQWLQQNPADIITMHLGTNDIVQGHNVQEIIDAFTTLVEQMRDSNPSMKIIVAQIIPLSFNFGSATTESLNQAIPGWAEGMNSTESPIWVVDMADGYTTNDLRDGVHPNDSGDRKMADKWYPFLTHAIDMMSELEEPAAPVPPTC